MSCHCVKSVRIRSISLYSVRMRENADQNNSDYEHFLRSVGPGGRLTGWQFLAIDLRQGEKLWHGMQVHRSQCIYQRIHVIKNQLNFCVIVSLIFQSISSVGLTVLNSSQSYSLKMKCGNHIINNVTAQVLLCSAFHFVLK